MPHCAFTERVTRTIFCSRRDGAATTVTAIVSDAIRNLICVPLTIRRCYHPPNGKKQSRHRHGAPVAQAFLPVFRVGPAARMPVLRARTLAAPDYVFHTPPN